MSAYKSKETRKKVANVLCWGMDGSDAKGMVLRLGLKISLTL